VVITVRLRKRFVICVSMNPPFPEFECVDVVRRAVRELVGTR
jgi:hypothetical protein